MVDNGSDSPHATTNELSDGVIFIYIELSVADSSYYASGGATSWYL